MAEQHPLQPFLPANARLLMLGTFPPQRKRWCMDFYYPNFINDMWRIVGICFFGDKQHFVAADGKRFDQRLIEAFCSERGIALYDTATAVCRTNGTAADKDLQILQPTDIGQLLRGLPHCQAIATTGQLATTTACTQLGVSEPRVGGHTEFAHEGRTMRLYRMPSSSRAYPMALDRKAATYQAIFDQIF